MATRDMEAKFSADTARDNWQKRVRFKYYTFESEFPRFLNTGGDSTPSGSIRILERDSVKVLFIRDDRQ